MYTQIAAGPSLAMASEVAQVRQHRPFDRTDWRLEDRRNWSDMRGTRRTGADDEYSDYLNCALSSRSVLNVNPTAPEVMASDGRVLGWTDVPMPEPTNLNFTHRGQPGWGERIDAEFSQHARLLKPQGERMQNTTNNTLHCDDQLHHVSWINTPVIPERALNPLGHLAPHQEAMNTRAQRKYVTGTR